MRFPADRSTAEPPASERDYYPDPADPRNDLWTCTIREAAARVLADAHGGWLHYREIARLALARGYRTNRMQSTPDIINKSFFDTMRRQPEFERSGPLFRLPAAE